MYGQHRSRSCLWPALRADGGQRRLVRLAGAAGPVPKSFPGVKTSRDAFLIDTDLDRLRERVADYFNPELSHEEIARRYPAVMKDHGAVRCPRRSRCAAHARRSLETGFVRYAYRPFDNRWLYWEADSEAARRKAPDYKPHVFEGTCGAVLGSTTRRVRQNPKPVSHTRYPTPRIT